MTSLFASTRCFQYFATDGGGQYSAKMHVFPGVFSVSRPTIQVQCES